MTAKQRKGQTPRKKRRIRLVVIPEPEPDTRVVLILDGEGTVVMSGPGGPTTMECGNCGAPLATDIELTLFVGSFVLKCNRCGLFNETPT